MKILEVKNISKQIKGKTVLSNITFEASSGEVIGLIGSNGAGKSTLLKMISNLLRPDSGEVLYNEINIHTNFEKIAHKIGYLIEDPALYPYLTAKEQLELCFKLQGKAVNSNIIEAVANGLQTTSFMDKKIKKYSMGMRQRLGIACAVIHNPDLVILDEPTNSIDVNGIKLVKQYILALRNQGKLVIVSSHLLNEIQSICDRFIMLENGKLVSSPELNAKQEKIYRIEVGENPASIEFLKEAYSIRNSSENLFIEVPSSSLNTTIENLVQQNIHIKDIEKVNIDLAKYFRIEEC